MLDDIRVHTRHKLSALWAAVMFCYIYGDYFDLYVPGKLQGMLGGDGPFGPVSQASLTAASALLALPGLMVFLSLALPAAFIRWLNIVVAASFIVVMLMTMPGAWTFYIFFGVVEIVLKGLIVWTAWRWPRHNVAT